MPANFAHKIPDTWSFEKSAGLIVVYATVIWCLAVVGALRNGQVYTTVGSEEKVQYLVNECHIPRSHFLDREVVHANRITCFDAADAASAFRYMQSDKHIGKIVIRIPEDAADLPTATSLATPE
ncbi:Fum1p [Aspergillus luchuensis]|uniref:Fum1p n=1 Tax=Aspergillus kawachii TaxID=1069201 RepID=A0A146FJP6_ASPKA|nr:Fum1p [Aspergillus luchuensis]